MSVLLGCIADDFTGATDLANMLVRGGMRTVQVIGVPGGTAEHSLDESDAMVDVDAIVIALKSRTIEPDAAVSQSLAALRWLQSQGARQIYFKYCSTFDSTYRGNIGPVADALLDALGADFAIVCPAFPENGRTIFRGYLFVGDVLLNESGMQNHPLTPMTDANLVRVLQQQTPAKVGLVRHDTVARGATAIYERFTALRADGARYAVVDALTDADLHAIGAACANAPLITGGSGVAIGLPNNFKKARLLSHTANAASLPATPSRAVVLSGSCSRATNAQVQHWAAHHPAFRIDPLALARGEDLAGSAVQWANQQTSAALIFATAEPDDVKRAQTELGADRAGQLVEHCLASIARGLAAAGVRRFVIAGGETAGAVVNALGVRALRIGPQIDPGVPWTATLGPDPIALALKSGNFGSVDFFAKALGMLR